MAGLATLLEKLYKFLKKVSKLVDATRQNSSDILELEQQLTELNEAVRRLAYEISRINERQVAEQTCAWRILNWRLSS